VPINSISNIKGQREWNRTVSRSHKTACWDPQDACEEILVWWYDHKYFRGRDEQNRTITIEHMNMCNAALPRGAKETMKQYPGPTNPHAGTRKMN